jgi:hypothetical protein
MERHSQQLQSAFGLGGSFLVRPGSETRLKFGDLDAERGLMSEPALAVLLVGCDFRGSHALQDHLKRRGCDITLAASCAEALGLLRTRSFDLVLSEFMLTDGTAYELIPPLLDTRASMFFSNAVEDGCWWMNAIEQGQDRTEDPGMRPAQFRTRLDEIFFDRQFGKPRAPSPRAAGRSADSRPPLGVRDSRRD